MIKIGEMYQIPYECVPLNKKIYGTFPIIAEDKKITKKYQQLFKGEIVICISKIKSMVVDFNFYDSGYCCLHKDKLIFIPLSIMENLIYIRP
jgi:hypothetical protein